MLSDAFTWIVLHPFIAGAVLILCLIVLERLTRRKWPWRFKATVTYVCDGDSVGQAHDRRPHEAAASRDGRTS